MQRASLQLIAVLAAFAACRARAEHEPTGAMLVAAPTQSVGEGWLDLTRGESLDTWDFYGADAWQIGDVKLDPVDSSKLVVARDVRPAAATGLTFSTSTTDREKFCGSKLGTGDHELELDFLLARGARASVFAMGAYEIRLRDSQRGVAASIDTCGALVPLSDINFHVWPGRAPNVDAYRGPGEWHSLRARVTAVRWDDNPNNVWDKLANARISVSIDGITLHDDVELPGASGNQGCAHEAEMMYRGVQLSVWNGAAAFRNVRVHSREPRDEYSDWVSMFDGKSLDGWTITDDGKWKVEHGEIVGSRPASFLSSARGDYKNFEVRAKCKINAGGDSGLFVRASFDAGRPTGYEAQINSTGSDPARTGSLYGLAAITTQLVPPDTWFDLEVNCVDGHITIWVNDFVTVNYFDAKRTSGHIALEQHHDGSVVHFKDVEVRELP